MKCMSSQAKVSAIIPAAGSGIRIGGDTKKQYIHLHNKPILVRTIERLSSSRFISEILLVVPESDVEYCENEIVSLYSLNKIKRVITGGKERQDSVHNGIEHISPDTDIIMVHDAVRPFISEKLIKKSIETAAECGSVVVAVPEKDTVKEATTEGLIIKTLQRQRLWRIQTPQVFRRDILVRAYDNAVKTGFLGTDESSLVEQIGEPVTIINGSYLNIKITAPEDILLAESIFKIMSSVND